MFILILFSVPFLFDDKPSIVDDYLIRNIHHLQNIWNFWPTRFVTYFSFAFNYLFGGLNVFGYHVFNLMVHLISAALVWLLTLLTFSTPVMKEEKIARHADVISLFAGLVFVAHPVQTEAVTYYQLGKYDKAWVMCTKPTLGLLLTLG